MTLPLLRPRKRARSWRYPLLCAPGRGCRLRPQVSTVTSCAATPPLHAAETTVRPGPVTPVWCPSSHSCLCQHHRVYHVHRPSRSHCPAPSKTWTPPPYKPAGSRSSSCCREVSAAVCSGSFPRQCARAFPHLDLSPHCHSLLLHHPAPPSRATQPTHH